MCTSFHKLEPCSDRCEFRQNLQPAPGHVLLVLSIVILLVDLFFEFDWTYIIYRPLVHGQLFMINALCLAICAQPGSHTCHPQCYMFKLPWLCPVFGWKSILRMNLKVNIASSLVTRNRSSDLRQRNFVLSSGVFGPSAL